MSRCCWWRYAADMGGWEMPALSDGACAFSDLREDFVYARIPRARRAYYIERGLALGREGVARYLGQDLESLLRADGVVINRVEEPSPWGLHAQICWDKATRQIDIFADTARALSQALEGAGLEQGPEALERLFLAHEFYHWLEYSGGVPASEKCAAVEWRVLGLFPRRAQVRRVDEIAAFAFAKELCGLPVHPKAMDYILLYRRQGEGLGQITQRLRALEADYRRECL